MPTERASNEGGEAIAKPATPPGYQDDPTVNGGFRRRKLGQKGWASSTHFCKHGCALRNCRALPKCKSVSETKRQRGFRGKANTKFAKQQPAWPPTSQSTVVHTTGRGGAGMPLPEPVPVLELDVAGVVLNE